MVSTIYSVASQLDAMGHYSLASQLDRIAADMAPAKPGSPRTPKKREQTIEEKMAAAAEWRVAFDAKVAPLFKELNMLAGEAGVDAEGQPVSMSGRLKSEDRPQLTVNKRANEILKEYVAIASAEIETLAAPDATLLRSSNAGYLSENISKMYRRAMDLLLPVDAFQALGTKIKKILG